MALPRRSKRGIRSFLTSGITTNPLFAQSQWVARAATPDLTTGAVVQASFKQLCDTLDGYRFNTIFEQLGAAGFDVVTAIDIEDLRPRGIYNPAPAIIDFYAKHVLTGQMSRPPQDDVTMLADPDAAMPAGDLWVTSENRAIPDAVIKIWRWSNLQLTKTDLATNCATYGNCLLIVNEVAPRTPQDTGKVLIEVSHPAHLVDWECDLVGNFTYATVRTTEYRRSTEQRNLRVSYQLERVYTPDEYRIYEDGVLVSTTPNPHGFVPIVLVKHKPVSGDFWGLNAFVHALPQIQELCLVASVLGTNILMHQKPRWVVMGANAPAAGEEIEAKDDMWFIPNGAKLDVLIPELSIQDTYVHLNRLLQALERDFPEITLNQVADNKRDVSGAGVRGILGGLIRRGLDARERYEEGLKNAIQMAISMGQHLGGTDFNVFGAPVGDYHDGELEFEFHWPDIMPLSRLERLRIAAEEKTLELQIVTQEATIQLARTIDPAVALGLVEPAPTGQGGNTPPPASSPDGPAQGTPTK